MRTFEEDFEFDRNYFEMGVAAKSTSACRIDSHRTVTTDPNRKGDSKYEARLAAHTKRIRNTLGIK